MAKIPKWEPNKTATVESEIEEKIEDSPVKFLLNFPCNGWCEELQRSYRKGTFRARDEKEYQALKKYSI